MSDNHQAVTLELGRPERDGRRVCIIKRDGNELHRDKIDPNDARHRKGYCERFGNLDPGSAEYTEGGEGGEILNLGWLDRRIIQTAVAADGGGEAINYEWMTSAELDAIEDDDPYLVDNVLPQAQGGMIGGKFKTLKTAVACDLVLSVATGTPFLGTFAVPELRRAGIMSSEVGRKVLKKRARAVAKAKGFELGDVPDASWSAACPRIGNLLHHDALERDIVDRDLSLLVIDPSYLALCEAGDSATKELARNNFGISQLLC